MEITLPPPPTQRAIAKVLGDLDDKIALLQARALFRAWFVDFLPVRAKAAGATSFRGMPQEAFEALPASFVSSEIGDVPQGWTVEPLDKIADFLNGLPMQKYRPIGDDAGLPVIKIAELRKGLSDRTERGAHTISEKYRVHDGDLIFSWSGSLMAKFWTDGDGALNQHLFKVSSNRVPLTLVAHWLWYHMRKFQRIAEAKATTMGHIKRGHLSEAKVILPPANMLAGLVTAIDHLVQKQIANSLEQRTLASIRSSLLPKLILNELEPPSLEALIADERP
jgi:type I restriction enzyme S subunit